MSRTVHRPSSSRRLAGGDCPNAVATQRPWYRDCFADPRSHPGGACTDTALHHPTVVVVDRSHRRDGTVAVTEHTADQLGYAARAYARPKEVAGYANQAERSERARTRVTLSELAVAVSAGDGPADLDVCDEDGLVVAGYRHRHSAIWDAS